MKGEKSMEEWFAFVSENKEWLLSGIGVALISWLGLMIKTAIKGKLSIRKLIRNVFRRKINSNKDLKDDSQFISESPFDGIAIQVGEKFTKSWTIKNSGNCTWRNRRLVCVEYASSYFYPVEKEIKIPVTKPGENVTLKVVYIVTAEGCYTSRWKMYDENNNLIFPKKHIGLAVNIIAKKEI